MARPEDGALAANTKNEFYISTFAIICIIYDVLGNVVKLRPLKTLRVCVGHPSAAFGAMAMENKNTEQRAGKNSNKTIMPKCGPSNIHEADSIPDHENKFSNAFDP